MYLYLNGLISIVVAKYSLGLPSGFMTCPPPPQPPKINLLYTMFTDDEIHLAFKRSVFPLLLRRSGRITSETGS